eukprot:gene54007-5171_t
MHGGTDPMTDGANEDAFVEWAAGRGYEQTQPWRPWTVDGEKHVAGHLMQWGGGALTWLR